MESEEWVTGRVVVALKGIPMQMQLTVPAKPVKPQRMLPVFQKMSNSFVGMSVDAMDKIGEKISCKAGCSACCSHPVPVAEVEVYQIAELVESMPEPRRTEIKKRFSDAVEHFRSIGWFERVKKLGDLSVPENPDLVGQELIDAALEYFYQGVPCPFLEDNSCSIHESRPLICREYLVTSPAENCSHPTAATIKKVPTPVKLSRSLDRVGSTGNFSDVGVLPLIRALELAKEFPEQFPEKTGQAWAAEFFEHLTKSEIPS